MPIFMFGVLHIQYYYLYHFEKVILASKVNGNDWFTVKDCHSLRKCETCASSSSLCGPLVNTSVSIIR